MNVLDLFSGIGGFSLGLERAGMRTVAFCEIEPYCRAVLAKHWPGVSCYTDIRELTADRLVADGIRPDVICGGFPCQDISVAGKNAGIEGERSGLWREYSRLIGEIRPRYVIMENVSALLARGLGEVLGELAALGYDAQWHCIPASHIGAPHRRDRIWIVAYPNGSREPQSGWGELAERGRVEHGSKEMADATGSRLEGWKQSKATRPTLGSPRDNGWWSVEPDVGRVAHGVSSRVDRLKCLGNAVIPQIPEIIGRAIMSSI